MQNATTTSQIQYCDSCGVADAKNAGDLCPRCSQMRGEKKQSEIAAVLERTGLASTFVVPAVPAAIDENDPMAIMAAAQVEVKPVPVVEERRHWVDDLEQEFKAAAVTEPLPTLSGVADEILGASSIEPPDLTGGKQKPVIDLAAISETLTEDLVPMFGEILRKYEDGALSLGFPPAVNALITRTGLTPERTAEVLAGFKQMFALADAWEQKAYAIVVQSEDQTDLIKEANDLYKLVCADRINVEKKRVQLKQPALREGQLIDGISNCYKERMAPIEEHLKNQAKYKEVRLKAREDALRTERTSKLSAFGQIPASLDLGKIAESEFDLLMKGAIAEYNAKQEAERLAEEARKEELRKSEEERVRLAAANKVLEQEKAAEATRNAELQKQADEERKKAEAAQAELDRQEAARKAEEARLAAEAEAKRLAPDKEKLVDYAQSITDLMNASPSVDARFEPSLAAVRSKLMAAIEVLQRATEKI